MDSFHFCWVSAPAFWPSPTYPTRYGQVNPVAEQVGQKSPKANQGDHPWSIGAQAVATSSRMWAGAGICDFTVFSAHKLFLGPPALVCSNGKSRLLEAMPTAGQRLAAK